MYEKKLTNKLIYSKIAKNGLDRYRIVADCASPKDIAELRNLGLTGIVPCRKGKDSINHGIQTIQNYKLHIHPNCKNFIHEVNSYCWDKAKDGTLTGKPVDKNNHLCDALRYSISDAAKPPTFSFD